MTDPIADMLTRIRNALVAKHETVEIPASKMKSAIADILLKEGYVAAVKFVEEGVSGKLVITLKYVGKRQSVINGLQRVSKPGLRTYSGVEKMPKVMDGGRAWIPFEGLRTYSGVEKMPKVMDGLGVAILSTNKGVMTDKQAKAANVGGEVLCYIW